MNRLSVSGDLFILLSLSAADYAAGNFFSGISGGL